MYNSSAVHISNYDINQKILLEYERRYLKCSKRAWVYCNEYINFRENRRYWQHWAHKDAGRIKEITKLSNSYKGKVRTHNYIKRQNQSTTGKLWKRNDPDLVQAFLKNGGLNQILKRQTSRFHYDSKVRLSL